MSRVTRPDTTMVALALLATHRLTRLVTSDYLTDDLRRRLQRKLPEKGAYLIGCPWCASFWLGAVVAAATWRWPRSRFVGWAWTALAGSTISGLIAGHEETPDYGEQLEDLAASIDVGT